MWPYSHPKLQALPQKERTAFILRARERALRQSNVRMTWVLASVAPMVFDMVMLITIGNSWQNGLLLLVPWCIAAVVVWRVEGRVVERYLWEDLKGLCLSCGYDLTNNTSGVCPECGERVVVSYWKGDAE